MTGSVNNYAGPAVINARSAQKANKDSSSKASFKDELESHNKRTEESRKNTAADNAEAAAATAKDNNIRHAEENKQAGNSILNKADKEAILKFLHELTGQKKINSSVEMTSMLQPEGKTSAGASLNFLLKTAGVQTPVALDEEMIKEFNKFDNPKLFIKLEKSLESISGEKLPHDVLRAAIEESLGNEGLSGKREGFLNRLIKGMTTLKAKADTGDNAGGFDFLKGGMSGKTSISNEAKGNMTFAGVSINELPELTGKMAAKLTNGSTVSARLVLKPESLGTVFVDLRMENGTISVKFRTEKPEAASALESRLSALADKFRQNGIKIDNIDIKFNNEHQAQEHNAWQDKKEKDNDRKFMEEFVRSFKNTEENVENESVHGSFIKKLFN
ncbi:MAG: flagellar hook-length control protein FliK [Candidatus Kapaibacterium sp.]